MSSPALFVADTTNMQINVSHVCNLNRFSNEITHFSQLTVSLWQNGTCRFAYMMERAQRIKLSQMHDIKTQIKQ